MSEASTSPQHFAKAYGSHDNSSTDRLQSTLAAWHRSHTDIPKSCATTGMRVMAGRPATNRDQPRLLGMGFADGYDLQGRHWLINSRRKRCNGCSTCRLTLCERYIVALLQTEHMTGMRHKSRMAAAHRRYVESVVHDREAVFARLVPRQDQCWTTVYRTHTAMYRVCASSLVHEVSGNCDFFACQPQIHISPCEAARCVKILLDRASLLLAIASGGL